MVNTRPHSAPEGFPGQSSSATEPLVEAVC